MRSSDAANETPTRDLESATVSFTLLGLECAHDRGRLLGLVGAEIMLAGVAFVVQGLRVIYEPNGSLLVQPPRFRHPDGQWLPTVIWPPELEHFEVARSRAF